MNEPKRVIRQVSDSDGLNQLYTDYLGLLAEDREMVLEIVLAPGEYGVASCGSINLTLKGSPPPRVRKIDVVLRSASPDEPAVLADTGVDIDARTVTLQDLVLARRHHHSLLRVRFGGRLELRGCAFLHCRLHAPFGGTLLELAELYEHGPSEVSLTGCWFVGNAAVDPGGLIAIAAASRSALRSVTFEGCMFLDNRFGLDLAAVGAAEVAFRGCTVLRPPQEPVPGLPHGRGLFAQVVPVDAPVTFDDCLLVLDRAADLGTNPITLSDCLLRVSDPAGVELPLTLQASASAPRSFALEPAVVEGLAALTSTIGDTALPRPLAVRQGILGLIGG